MRRAYHRYHHLSSPQARPESSERKEPRTKNRAPGCRENFKFLPQKSVTVFDDRLQTKKQKGGGGSGKGGAANVYFPFSYY